MDKGIEIQGLIEEEIRDEILEPDALELVAHLENIFGQRRKELLLLRQKRQSELESGVPLDFLQDTKDIRTQDWLVAKAPRDLNERRVEITGPVDAKMMINALNSGANVFMADLEDSLSPRWDNVVKGQLNLKNAVKKTLRFKNEQGKEYSLNTNTATLLVRPRGFHLVEKNITLASAPVSASFFDFALYIFHNHEALKARGSGPYFYLPKLESHLEARLWNDIFIETQKCLDIPVGTIRATVLIETILAAFEMEEILFELKEHAAGLNAGRWDYIFSLIKKFKNDKSKILPDRNQVTMAVPFMRNYAQLLVKSCHKHGAHAIGGMSAFIPNRNKPEVTERALLQVRIDKEREAKSGFDGTWVAHPDLVAVAKKVFDEHMGSQPHQKHMLCSEVQASAASLLDTRIEGYAITENGVRNNISVAIQYIANWLAGNGAVAINDLMEDAATAEISRAQLWQWLRNKQVLSNGEKFTTDLYLRYRDEELSKISGLKFIREATQILDSLVQNEVFSDFLTTSSYDRLH